MTSKPQLSLEILNGPLDGNTVTLESETIWGKSSEGPLAFLWDTELAERQARFFFEGENWWLEGFVARHGTYHNMERVEKVVPLQKGDLLKASAEWMLVGEVETVRSE